MSAAAADADDDGEAGENSRATNTTLLDALAVEQIALSDTFTGTSIKTFWGRIFGGQIMAQAVSAAASTVPDDRPMHSIHGYFVLAGRLHLPLLFRVIRIRDGGSFSTRIVNVLQENRVIFTMTASFHRPEAGPEFQIPMSELRAVARYQLQGFDFGERSAPRPIGVPTPTELLDSGSSTIFVDISGTIERMSVAVGDRWVIWWGRYVGPAVGPADWRTHQAIVTYMSDFGMVDAAKLPHVKTTEFGPSMSLDHALHFHRPVDAAQWLCFHMETCASAAARGLSRAAVFTQAGQLVASVVQESLARVKRDPSITTSPSQAKL
mmetsp:Transcript_6183/g.15886  ORF Transcript_6183/g.15886 Transcript_6183/m.15886 type:complete len:322 (-) Transcript_6183:173-1138(-)